MGISESEIFGDRSPAPATPGSYGESPRDYRLPDGARIARVRLQIADLSRSLSYYERILGMAVIERHPTAAVLGTGDGVALVELEQRAGARPAPRRGRLGLYHFAVLLPHRAALGQFLHHLAATNERFGTADHLVSESLYLQDPDNLGIEVYADRPRETWRRVGRELMMATDPLDLDGLQGAAGGVAWGGMPAGTVIGHVHLHVGDLATASAYYSDALGLDRTVWSYPGALFLAAGGYHHTLGTNIWSGQDATAPPPDEAQLLEWTMELPDASELDALTRSLTEAGYVADRDPSDRSALRTRDPWGTQIGIHLATL
jgi:catechol 2,3-dioxygenase